MDSSSFLKTSWESKSLPHRFPLGTVFSFAATVIFSVSDPIELGDHR
jgi:hypothetical protein